MDAAPDGAAQRRTPRSRKPRTPLPERLVRRLAQEILDGRLTPGVRLEEQALADRFKVSRTPVREALQRLAATGLVERRPHKGVVVCSFDARHVADLFEAMRELEALCARLAATRMTEAERRRLTETHDAMATLVTAEDVDAYETANHRFHALIYQGSHNRCLEDMAQTTRLRVAPFRDLQFQLSGRLARSHHEHALVVQAILEAQPEAAARHMGEHVGRVESASARYVRHQRGPAKPDDDGHAPD